MSSFGSSVINKTGKKVAPKAPARRRVAPPAASKPVTETAKGTEEPQAQSNDISGSVATDPIVTAVTRTQNVVTVGAQSSAASPGNLIPECSTPNQIGTSVSLASGSAPRPTPPTSIPSPSSPELSPKRRRIADVTIPIPAISRTVAVSVPAREELHVAVPSAVSRGTASDVAAPDSDISPAAAPTPAADSSTVAEESAISASVNAQAATTAPHVLNQSEEPQPQAASQCVNVDPAAPSTDTSENAGTADGHSQNEPPSTAARGKRKTGTITDKRAPTAPARRNARNSTTQPDATSGDDQSVEPSSQAPPAKKARKPRKDKGQKRTATDAPDAIGASSNDASAEATENSERPGGSARLANAVKRKRKAMARAAALQGTTPVENDTAYADEAAVDSQTDLDEDSQPKRRRGKRATTPEGAEDMTIEPETVMMFDIAGRDLRMGMPSEREKQMQQIDWEEVKKRRKEEERRMAFSRGRKDDEDADEAAGNDGAAGGEDGEEVDLDEQLRRTVQANRKRQQALRIRLVNGQHEIDEDSRVVDRHAMVDEEIELLEEVEEDDLTKHFNVQTYVNMRRRVPEERVRTNERWTDTATDKFYAALSQFGCDFMIISQLFPGRTRRQVKAKFVREERADPERVREALQGHAGAPDDERWSLDLFSRETGMKLRDPRELEDELRRERESKQQEIEEARKTRVEMERQMRLAGFGADGEGTEQGRKKKRGRDKGAAAGGQEVEVLEEFSD